MHRSHTCGELTAKNIGETVTLSGWVANRRDHGGVIFIDMRDRYGITQTVYDPADGANPDTVALAETYRSEYVVKITGLVRARPNAQNNDKLVTGEIEIAVQQAEVVSESKLPPFEIDDHSQANEEIRLKHRYLDLRRKPVLETIEFRA